MYFFMYFIIYIHIYFFYSYIYLFSCLFIFNLFIIYILPCPVDCVRIHFRTLINFLIKIHILHCPVDCVQIHFRIWSTFQSKFIFYTFNLIQGYPNSCKSSASQFLINTDFTKDLPDKLGPDRLAVGKPLIGFYNQWFLVSPLYNKTHDDDINEKTHNIHAFSLFDKHETAYYQYRD